MVQTLPNPLYYLDNFRRLLDWIGTRYDDLLASDERAFLATFPLLPEPAQALLVRMVMRKGELFRHSKLRYAEIGDTAAALHPLADLGWVDTEPALSLEQLFRLLKKDELVQAFGGHSSTRKEDLLIALQAELSGTKPLSAWSPALADPVYRIAVDALCERLRLLFFGNLYQDWSEFVLADLGVFSYESVEFSPASRAFQERADVEAYLHLHRCRERFHEGEEVAAVLADIPVAPYANPWLEGRRGKLLFQLGQQQEKLQDWPAALAIYQACPYPGARLRTVRVLERCERYAEALALAEAAAQAPEGEEELQQLGRMLPRLRRKLGQTKPAARSSAPLTVLELQLPQGELPVELLVREHLTSAEAPVFYVENALINSLFGLLCWPAIFAPLPGAFFHPFQSGPADLHHPDFYTRRAALFEQRLGLLESGDYRAAILETWQRKRDRQSPFVFWSVLDEPLLELALDCIPAAHLRLLFTRLLRDLKNNRSGFPDLIQFWPAEKCYRMVEVKGPGDRLQDNQVRWLDYCVQHEIPVAVCYVSWAAA